MRTPVNRRNNLEPSSEAPDTFESNIEEEDAAPPTFSMTKVLLIFLAGVLLASGATALTLWAYKDKIIRIVNPPVKEVGTTSSNCSSNDSGLLNSNPGRVFVMYDVGTNAEGLEKERIISYDISDDKLVELHSVPHLPDTQSLSNPQVSSDGSTIFFCQAADAKTAGGKKMGYKVAQLWRMDSAGGNKKMIIPDAGLCDYSVKRTTGNSAEQGLIYANGSGSIFFYNSRDNKIKNLTADIDIPDHHLFISPVLRDNDLFYFDDDWKLYKIELDNSKTTRSPVNNNAYTGETKLKVSPDGQKLIILEETGQVEIMSIIPDDSFRKVFTDLTDVFFSKDGNHFFTLRREDNKPVNGLTQCAIARIDMKQLQSLSYHKESLLNVFSINILHGIDLLSSN